MIFETEIIEIKDETWDVKTFKLKRPAGLDFVSGQYCTVAFKDKPAFLGESRPFTFSSSPTEKEYVTFTIKKMHEFTTELHNAKIGDKIIINGPDGKKLNFDDNIKEDIVFIAGGSGITPFISAIRYAIAKDMKNQIHLLYSNKTRLDIIFRSELNLIKYNHKNFHLTNIITTNTCAGDSDECGRRIDEEIVRKYIPEPEDKLYYLCGPPPMMDAMEKMLKKMGINENKIRIEDWKLPGKHDDLK